MSSPKLDVWNREVRRRCPVCGASVYSRGGVHPQCADAVSDPHRRQKPGVKQPEAEVPAAAESQPAKNAKKR
jgi:hypothetical protein